MKMNKIPSIQEMAKDFVENLDYYELSHCSSDQGSYLVFQGHIFATSFDCHSLFKILIDFREKIHLIGITGVTIQEYRDIIFLHSGIDNINDLATVYNIIEAWCGYANKTTHKGEKSHLFESFLKQCEAAINHQIPNQKNSIKPTAKICAISYLFELDLLGRQPPTNSGGFAQKIIDEFGEVNYGYKSFTKILRSVLNYDRYNLNDLKNIHKNWRELVIELSPNPDHLDNYLKKKNL